MKIVQIVGTTQGVRTVHDGNFVVAWNPHVRFGVVDLKTTEDPAKARRFENVAQVFEEWRAVSIVQGRRPDGRPNRPLTAFTITIEKAPGP